MEAALLHALEPDSPYFEFLVGILSRLPGEDIARCRTVSKSFRRLLYNDDFLADLGVGFTGFIFTPTPTSDFYCYYSFRSRCIFANIPRGPKDFQILSSNGELLLTTAYGLRWRIVNPVIGLVIKPPPRVFHPDEFVIAAAIKVERWSIYETFFLTCDGSGHAWMVSMLSWNGGSHFCFECDRRHHYDLSRADRDVLSGGAPRPGVYAELEDRSFVCVLFPKKKKLWVVSCYCSKSWMLQLLPEGAAGEEFELCGTSSGQVFLTWLSMEGGLCIWKLFFNSELDEPQFLIFRQVPVRWNYAHRLRVHMEHIDDKYLFLRCGRDRMLVYELETFNFHKVLIPMGDEGGAGDQDHWPPLFAYSCYLGNGMDRWQEF